MELMQVAEILGGEEVLGKRIENRMDLVDLGSQGITKKAVAHLADYLSLSMKEIAFLLSVTSLYAAKIFIGRSFQYYYI